MADMEQAGLNPILAYQQGGGPQPGSAQAGPPPNVEGEAVNTALAVRRAKQEITNMKSEEHRSRAQAMLADRQAGYWTAQTNLANYDAVIKSITTALDAKLLEGPLGEAMRGMQLGGAAAGGLGVASAVGASRAVRNLKNAFSKKKPQVTDTIKHGPNLTRTIKR